MRDLVDHVHGSPQDLTQIARLEAEASKSRSSALGQQF
jgi:hypothetical protein